MIQNLWDSVKSVLRQTFIAIQAYLKKEGNYQITFFKLTPKETRIMNC